MAWRHLKVSPASVDLRWLGRHWVARRARGGWGASLGEVWKGGSPESVGLFGTIVSLGTAASGHARAFTRVRLLSVNVHV